MARRRVNTTKYEIIQQGTKLFLEQGYYATSPKHICDELDISTGNLTYYFPTKEHLLAELVQMLCKFQGKLLKDMVQEEGATSLLAVCLELATMASMVEESEIARDLFQSAYSSPMCLEIIRRNDTQRSRHLYKEYCPDWSEEQFVEAQEKLDDSKAEMESGKEKLEENFNTLIGAIIKAKPAAAKGQYIKSCVIASTMGPGIKINQAKL